jgi:integrase
MAALNDVTIKAAIKDVQATLKPRKLADGAGRGTGRLVLRIRVMPQRVMSEWYAQQVSGGRRTLIKLGTYPEISLAEARQMFVKTYAPAIASKTPLREAEAIKPGTVADLFAAYVASLRKREAASADLVRDELTSAEKVIGGTKLARDIRPGDVIRVLRPIYERGSASMADHMRTYIRAAFSWGLKSELDYRSSAPKRYGLTSNPAADIPAEPKTVGQRWLELPEFKAVYAWLGGPENLATEHYCKAIKLLMLTGCRVQEISTLQESQWDPKEKLLTWGKTKNGTPHTLPVCDLAAEILNSLTPVNGYLFPSATDNTKPARHNCLYCVLWRVRDRIGVESFTNRDLRRTWKTLAGQAGLSKEIRDRLQNHSGKSDVSTKHYDRYEYLDEKRKAVEQWGAWIAPRLK